MTTTAETDSRCVGLIIVPWCSRQQTSSTEEEIILNLFVGDLREIVEERKSYRIDKTYVTTEPELAFELGGGGL